MTPEIQLVEAKIVDVMYDHSTDLFVYSPRREIDRTLVARLQTSIHETGNWQPIVVRAGTMEGIAGNHRFLALREIAEEVENLASASIPVMLVDCDESTAIVIALAENEFREDLTQWERVRALIQAAQKNPKSVENVFQVDGTTVEQLRLWEGLDYEAEIYQQRRKFHNQLTRKWFAVINTRLAEYPRLRAEFLKQIRNPTWVQAQTLDDLNAAITRAVQDYGIQFRQGRTWNALPTSQCLGCRLKPAELHSSLSSGENLPEEDGAVPGFCQHLRLFPSYIPHFVPDPDGVEQIPSGSTSAYPTDCISEDGQTVRGKTIQLLDHVDSYCVDPAIHQKESCFHQRESETAENAINVLHEQGIPGVQPGFAEEHKEEFIWLSPMLDGQPCTPKTCIHRDDEPPGYVVIAQKDGTCKMACVHARCGRAAMANAEQRDTRELRADRERFQVMLNHLRQASIERTLLADVEQIIDLTTPTLLKTIESAFVPAWDTEIMMHVLLGWQSAARSQIALECGIENLADKLIARQFLDRFGPLAESPNTTNIRQQFVLLRERAIQEHGVTRWLTCLAIIRRWKDRVANLAEAEKALAELLSESTVPQDS